MTTLPEMQRKIRQLDHDVQAIYEMLAGITATQGRHGNRLDEMDLKLDEMGSRLDGMDSKLDTIITMLGERRS